MEIASAREYSRQLRLVKDLLGPRSFRVLVPHFPPFASVRDREISGPLVELLKDFARLVEKTPSFNPLVSWDYERQITLGQAITVAAPIYVRPGQTLSIYRFCELETCYCVVNSNVVRDFSRKLGLVHSLVGSINALFFEYTENPQSCDFLERYKDYGEQLRDSIRDLLGTCPQRSFAIPTEYDEWFVVNDYEFPTPQMIPCQANQDVLPLIRRYADDGYIVLCNSVVRGQLLRESPEEQYLSKPLLKTGIPTWAGIPFSEQDKQIGDFFGNFLRYGDPRIEELLAACKADGITILPRTARTQERFRPTGSLAWAARLSRCENYSDIVLESVARETSVGRRRRVLNAIVMRIDSLDQSAYADVRLQDGEAYRLRRIEVWRLAAAGLAYSGAQFHYIVEDIGSNRVVRLEPDVEANAEKRDELESLLGEFLHNEVPEKANEAKTPHSDA